jgi:predicted PurR-regulated permease PerM
MSTRARQRLIVLTALLAPALALGQPPPGMEAMATAVVVAGMIGSLVFTLGCVGLALYFASKHERHKLDTISKLVASGHPVPREMFLKKVLPSVEDQRRRDRRRGVSALCWAVGVALTFYLLGGDPRAPAWGLIFLFVSIGSFVNLYLSTRFEGAGKDDVPRNQ